MMNTVGRFNQLGNQAQMDKIEQPRLSKSASIVVSIIVFTALLPVVWFVLSIVFFTIFMAVGKPDVNHAFITIIAAVTFLTDCFLTRAAYKFFRSPRATSAEARVIPFSDGDWISAIVSFFLVWLLLLALTPFMFRIL